MIKNCLSNLVFELVALGTIITIASIVFVSINNSLNSFENAYTNIAIKLKVMCVTNLNYTYIILYNYGNEPYIINKIQDLKHELITESFIISGGGIILEKFNTSNIELPIIIHIEGETITLHNCIDVSQIISQG